MEIELLLLLFLGIVVLAFASKRNRRKKNRRIHTRSHRKDARVGLQPFDAKSSKPQTRKPVLKGRVHVVDGDTLVIQKTQIRLFGVDAPEINHPYGKKAKWALVSLCKGQIVQAETTDQDDHGRTVARCYLQDGRDLSAEMVKLGLAIDWPKFSGGKYRALELPDVRKKLWLADARQKGRMHVWKKFESNQNSRTSKTEF
ncbi:MAG: thermonuclease family protein [Rhizobiaceae bacterium]|nr:thermonuclease family protein [Rhizobiaceae bacterium]